MNIITEKNLSKIIIYSFIIILTSMILAISYFYVKNTYDEFEVEMEKFVNEYYETKKRMLKKELNTIIDILNYNLAKQNISQNESKEDAIRLLNNIRFEKNKSNYYFVYDIKKIDGGDDFATLLVNPNRSDLVGTLLSTNYKDENGKKFREEFLNQIKLKGEAFTQYAYKKPQANEIKQKLSYFKFFDEWNWVIAVGVYIDDIEKEISEKKEDLKQRVKGQVAQNIVLFMMFLSIAILISIIISKKIDDILKKYQIQVLANENELKKLNQTLENRVKEEIDKNREKEQLLVQKSKFIALGEMISNIAHQWRQPLCELSSILMFIKFKHSINALDEKTINEKSKEAENVIEYMSQTIDDFRTFFMPKKEKETFYLYTIIDIVISIVASTLKNYNINVIIDVNKNIKLNTYLNEYEQVLLNIINNAKDVLIENKIKEPYIKISASLQNDYVIVYVEDNGGGIKTEPKNKIFEPYFTTKSDSDGTGIGLYMSKIIVDKNMKGKLRVKNTKVGARFAILIPINK